MSICPMPETFFGGNFVVKNGSFAPSACRYARNFFWWKFCGKKWQFRALRRHFHFSSNFPFGRCFRTELEEMF